MNVQKISLAETKAFKGLFLDYINQKPGLKPFYGNFPSIEGFAKQLTEKQIDQSTRNILAGELLNQYSCISIDEITKKQINLLKDENTFTITTGHQLNIFTGPLYFIYKILTVINLCERLKSEFPDKNFIPVYWMASEDHDYDEIKYFNLFGKKYIWETSQTGAVGKFSTEDIKNIITELPEQAPLFEKAYLENKNLTEATRVIVNELFGKYGLICLDGDSPSLKSLFVDIVKDDLLNHKANLHAEKTSAELNSLGYSPQVYPRSINLFYMENGLRNRIIKEENEYKVNDSELTFSEEEIIQLANSNPEIFSPNVILRPLYQEVILPNLAYIGGPAEVAYWLQLKSIFDNYNVSFPILLPRNFALVINKGLGKKIEKLGLSTQELFDDYQQLKQNFVARNADSEIQINDEINQINQLFDQIKAKANEVDKSLDGFIAAEGAKTNKSLDNIAKRLRKAEENKQEIEINQIENVLSKLFPNGSLQERHDNFLNFYLNNPQFIEELKSVFDPLDFKFNVINYNE